MRVHVCSAIIAIGVAAILTSAAWAQSSIGVARSHSSNLMIGLEAGFGEHIQNGIITLPCGCEEAMSGGRGNGWSGFAFFSIPFSSDFFFGVRTGVEAISTTSTSPDTENVMVESNPGDGPFPASIAMMRTADISMALLTFEPYLQYRILRSDFFLRVGPAVSLRLSKDLHQTRELESSTITAPDGSTLRDLAFPTGSQIETVPGGLPAMKSTLYSARFAGGYNFEMGSIVVAPVVAYTLPLSAIQTSGSWTISSFTGSLAFSIAP